MINHSLFQSRLLLATLTSLLWLLFVQSDYSYKNGIPVISNCVDSTFCGYGDTSSTALDQCVGFVELRLEASSDNPPATGLRIFYSIDLYGNGDRDILGYSDNVGPTYPFPNPKNIPTIRNLIALLLLVRMIFWMNCFVSWWCIRKSRGIFRFMNKRLYIVIRY